MLRLVTNIYSVVILAANFWILEARAQDALDDPAVWQILTSPSLSGVERLLLANQAIARLETSGLSEPDFAMDLLRIKAEALEELGRISEAAAVYGRKASMAAELGLSTRNDPMDLYRRSQDLHADIGNAIRAAALEREAASLHDQPISGPAGAPARPPKSEVHLLFATDRAPSDSSGPTGTFGHGRGDLRLGEAIVSIPPTHRRGQLEGPSILHLDLTSRKGRHVVLEYVEGLSSSTFYEEIDQRLASAPTPEILVVVHGYNVDFDTAMRRAAQISFDLRYEGVPIVYSWPSRGSTFGYIADAAVVRHSGRNLSRFLEDLLQNTDAQNIHLVAHSMGNRALTDALELLALRSDLNEMPLFEEVLFAAPDVDAGLFGEMAKTFRPLARRMTVYASSEDVALDVSRRIHGDAPRAGEGGKRMSVFEGIDGIDMSAVGDDMMAHDYFAEDSTALLDMFTLIWRNTPPSRRCGLVTVEGSSGATWRLEPGRCSDRTLLDLVAGLRQAGIDELNEARSYVDGLAEKVALDTEAREFLLRLFAED